MEEVKYKKKERGGKIDKVGEVPRRVKKRRLHKVRKGGPNRPRLAAGGPVGNTRVGGSLLTYFTGDAVCFDEHSHYAASGPFLPLGQDKVPPLHNHTNTNRMRYSSKKQNNAGDTSPYSHSHTAPKCHIIMHPLNQITFFLHLGGIMMLGIPSQLAAR
jgi:hypothetical protein